MTMATIEQTAGIGLLVVAALAAVVHAGRGALAGLVNAPQPAAGADGKPATASAVGAGLEEKALRAANGLLFELGAIARRHPNDQQRKQALALLHQFEGILTGSSPAAVPGSDGSNDLRKTAANPLLSTSS